MPGFNLGSFIRKHDLDRFREAADRAETKGRAAYCYLPPTLANDGRAEIFAGSADDKNTIDRLIAFALWLTRQINRSLPYARNADREEQDGLSRRLPLPAA